MDKVRECRPAAVEGPIHIGAEECPPVFIADVREKLLAGDSGVAYQNVKLTKFIQHIVNHARHLLGISHVCLYRNGRPPCGPDLLGQRLGRRLGAVVIDRHPVPRRGKPSGAGRPDPTAPPGNEDGASRGCLAHIHFLPASPV